MTTPKPTPSKTQTPTTPPTGPGEIAKKPRKPREALPEFDVTGLSDVTVSADQKALFAPVKNVTRTDTQKYFDEKVMASLKTNPVRVANWDELNFSALAVETAKVEVIKQYIRKAAAFHGCRVRFGRVVAVKGGKSAVAFAAMPKAKGDADETE